MSSKPRVPGGIPNPGRPEPNPEAERTFIASAPYKTQFPWQAGHLRADVAVQLNVKQPEKLMAALDWLATETGETKRELVTNGLEEYIIKRLKALGLEY